MRTAPQPAPMTKLPETPEQKKSSDLAKKSMAEYLEELYPDMATDATKGFQDQVAANSQGFNSIRDNALRKGPSAWSMIARADQAARLADSREKMQNEVAGQAASARDQLAAQGGLSSGARERVAETGMKNAMGMSQDVGRQGNMGDLSISMQDETQRQQSMKDLATAENTRTQQWAQDRDKLNAYNMELYKTKMEALAAEKQANATRSSGKK